MDCSPPGSSVYGIFQVRILEWIAISSSRGSSELRYQTRVSMAPALASRFFSTETAGKPPFTLINSAKLSSKQVVQTYILTEKNWENPIPRL